MPPHFLSLPYDIRYLIYQHLFPPEEQIYIQALGSTLRSILPEDRLPTNALLACRQMHAEGSGYLYNSYLFNIVGTKKDCVTAYEPFLKTLRGYARHDVRINAFSNGEHSATMCISLQAGDARMGILKRRRRGEPKAISELEQEQGLAKDTIQSCDRIGMAVAACGVLLALLVWLLVSDL